MHSEKRWIALYVIVSVWLISLSSTLYQWIDGITPLMGSDINRLYFTLPLRSFIFFYTFASLLVFSLYLLTFNKVNNYQLQKFNETWNGAGNPIIKNNELKYAEYLPDYNIISLYHVSVLIKGFFLKSWNSTETVHGFISDRRRQQIEREKLLLVRCVFATRK